MHCNMSYTADQVNIGAEAVQITGPLISAQVIGKTYYCVYEFQAPPNHYVSADVVSVVTGESNFNFTEKT